MLFIIEIIIEIIVLVAGADESIKTRTTNQLKTYEIGQVEYKFYLLVAILLNIFYEDDLNFSIKERRRVKSYIRLSSAVTSRETRKELKKMLKHEVTTQHLVNIINNYSLKEHDINEAINIIENHMSKRDTDFKYTGLLRRVHTRLLSEL